MNTMLAGSTGFVGSNIARQREFSFYANSRNFKEAAGQHFDLVVFSAAPAVKWWANAHPAEDYSVICELIEVLSTMTVDRFVLISTIDVYFNANGSDESVPIEADAIEPYGRHRYLLESSVRGRFPQHHIIRLPGLFGPGLKKNVLYDLICNNMVTSINPESRYQWYPLGRISADIDRVIQEELRTVNFGTEPIATDRIMKKFFPKTKIAAGVSTPVSYDMQTMYSQQLCGKAGKYLLDAEEVLDELAQWLVTPEVTCV